MDVGSWQGVTVKTLYFMKYLIGPHIWMEFFMRWVEQVAHIGDTRNEYRISVGMSKGIDHLGTYA
jgi:hypothetical protein